MRTPASTSIAKYTDYSDPFVLGTPTTRGSSAAASRRARANALNCASTTWCALRPASTSTCSVIRDSATMRLEDVLGQRGVVGADRARRSRARRARGRAGPTGRRRTCTSASSSGTRRRRSGGCRPCRRAPRAAPARGRARCPRRCGGRRSGGRPSCARRGRSRRACRAGRACGRRTATPVSTSVGAGAVDLELDEDVALLGRALHARGPAHAVTSSSAARNAAFSSGVPTLTRSQPCGPVSRIRTPRSSSPCQTACRSGKCPNSTKFASLSATSWPSRAQPRDERVALGAQQRDLRLQLVGVRERGPRDRLGHGRQVVGQAHELHGVRRRPGRRRGSRGARRRGRTPCSSSG